ncbi:STAS domain-containing protein [Streptomyces sp. NPDC090056]|uniref:STAS domain-containing protein n=1 Tax=Streptomyces sp. NPDC090056 TaxID=3365934 RepID=UPI0037F16830
MNDRTDGTDHGLTVLHARFPSAYVLTLRGTADMFTAEDLDVDFAAATTTGPRLVVDLGALEYGDETLLGLLLDAHRTHGVELVGPLSPSFQRRLDTTGITGWFTIHPTLTSALAA